MQTSNETHTFKECFDLLLRIQSSKAPNTYEQSKCVIANLSPWFEANHPSLDGFETDFEETWSEFVANYRKIKPAQKLGHCRRYLTMALRRAHIKGWIPRKFSKTDFALMEASEPIGKYVPTEDVKRLLDWLEPRSPQTWLQVQIAFTMGLRISEVLKLRKEEIDWVKSEINLDPNRLKTRRARKVGIPITNAVRSGLEAACAKYESPYVFPMVKVHVVQLDKPQSDNSYWWTKARLATGVKCRFHDLRHSCLSNALARGMPPLTASKIFGATQQVIAQVYDHIRPEDHELHRSLMEG